GTVDTQASVPVGATKVTADISAFLFDVIASYQLGPLLLEARGVYSAGSQAGDNLSRSIHYFSPLDTDGNFFAGGWTQFWASGVDYFNQGWATTGNYVGYDRYGRGSIAFRATYNLTPALSLYGVVHTFLTAQSVDTDTGSQLASSAGVGPPPRTAVSAKRLSKADSNYRGTQGSPGMPWRFSANHAFDLVGGYLFAGAALDATECTNGAATCSTQLARKKSAQDAYTLAARIRLAF